MPLVVKDKKDCLYDLVSLGEVMLRLDPGEDRIRTAQYFRAWEGGGEYNVARGLARCFGLKTAVVTALVDNDVGWLIESLIAAGTVDRDLIVWRPFDGIGREVRNGLNFTERGFGVRGAIGISDRAYTAASQLKVGDIDWEDLFGSKGVRWFHTGGIFAALSETTPDVVYEAMSVAKKYGTIISYDLNYRPSLWESFGGLEQCRVVNRRLASLVDVMIGNEEDFTACLGFELDSPDDLSVLNKNSYEQMLDKVSETYPNIKVVGNTLREVRSASFNNWSAHVWAEGEIYTSKQYQDLEILDRVGGGDSFASGLIYGLMEKKDPGLAVEYGAAHGALAMTTAGDTTTARRKEVESLMSGGSARVVR